jgi:hypothetical protein
LCRLPEKSLERRLPARAQSWDAQSALNFSLGRSGKIEQRVDRGDSQALWALSNFDDVVASADLALFEHTKIEPRAAMCDQQSCHSGLIHSYANAIAGHTRLRDFEQSSADPVAVANADLIVSQTFHCEIFSELPEDKIVALQLLLPVAVRIHLVDKHSAVLSAMTVQITLCVTIDIEPSNQAPSLDRLLPH